MSYKCQHPVLLLDNARLWGRCGFCAPCLELKKDRMVAALMAEAASSGSVWAVTLTYAEEPEFFRYRDVQLFLKRLRHDLWRSGAGIGAYHNRLRYFAVGEKGDIGGRRHWHLILFFKHPVQRPYLAAKEKWSYWDHGWSRMSVVNVHASGGASAIKYAAKYLFKQNWSLKYSEGARSDKEEYETVRARWSTKPCLGHDYIVQEALRALDAGLGPQPNLTFAGTRSKGGKLWRHFLPRRQSRLYCLTYIAAAEHYGGQGALNVAVRDCRNALPGVDLFGPLDGYIDWKRRQKDLRGYFLLAEKLQAREYDPKLSSSVEDFLATGAMLYNEYKVLHGTDYAVAWAESERRKLPDEVVFTAIPFADWPLFKRPPALPLLKTLEEVEDEYRVPHAAERDKLARGAVSELAASAEATAPHPNSFLSAKRAADEQRAKDYWAQFNGTPVAPEHPGPAASRDFEYEAHLRKQFGPDAYKAQPQPDLAEKPKTDWRREYERRCQVIEDNQPPLQEGATRVTTTPEGHVMRVYPDGREEQVYSG